MASLPEGLELGRNFTLPHNETSKNASTYNPYPGGLQGVIIWTIPILIILLNTVVFIVIPRITALQPWTRVCMLSLAVSDFCIGTALIVNHVYMVAFAHYQVNRIQWACVLVARVMAIGDGTYALVLPFLSVNLLIEMFIPRRHPQIMTARNTRIIIVILWILFIGATFVDINQLLGPASRVNYYKHAFVCKDSWTRITTFPLIVCFFGFTLPALGIFCVAARRRKQAGHTLRDPNIFKILSIMTLG